MRSGTRQRRRAILEAALRGFTSRGFAGTTLDEIRSASGASTGSIYHHFASKEALAGALYVEGLRHYQQGLIEELRRHAGAERGVRAIVAYHLHWIEEHRDWARYLLHMRQASFVISSEGEILELNRAFFREIGSWFRSHVKRGELRDLPEDLVAAILIGPSQEFARHWLAGRVRSSLDQARRVLADAAWNCLRKKGKEDDEHALLRGHPSRRTKRRRALGGGRA